MAAPPKAKASPASPAPRSPSASADRTSTVVSWTLISLTVLGVLTVFWEPLAALAGAGPAAESVGDTHVTSVDGGVGGMGSAPAPSVTGPLDGSASS